MGIHSSIASYPTKVWHRSDLVVTIWILTGTGCCKMLLENHPGFEKNWKSYPRYSLFVRNNYYDHTYSTIWLALSWHHGGLIKSPHETPRTPQPHGTEGFKGGGLKYSPIMPIAMSLLESRCNFFKSGVYRPTMICVLLYTLDFFYVYTHICVAYCMYE